MSQSSRSNSSANSNSSSSHHSSSVQGTNQGSSSQSKTKQKAIALVAHDNKKKDLLEWVEWNHEFLAQHRLVCTGTTGRLVQELLESCLNGNSETQKSTSSITMTRLLSGPLGGDQQLGALIVEGKVDFMIFFWDPMEPHPHDVDVKALLRIAVAYNIPIACNRATADYLISSPLMVQEYRPRQASFVGYADRKIDLSKSGSEV